MSSDLRIHQRKTAIIFTQIGCGRYSGDKECVVDWCIEDKQIRANICSDCGNYFEYFTKMVDKIVCKSIPHFVHTGKIQLLDAAQDGRLNTELSSRPFTNIEWRKWESYKIHAFDVETGFFSRYARLTKNNWLREHIESYLSWQEVFH